MKNILLVIFFVFYSVISCGQITVGIGQTFSNSVFQVKGDSLSSDPTNLLLVTDDGNIGIGVANPEAKLHIVKSASSNFPSLRIDDGKFALGKVVSSDANGYLEWIDTPNPQGANYSMTFSSVQNYLLNQDYFLIAMPVNTKGLYQVVLRWWGISNAVDQNNLTAALFSLVNSLSATDNWANDQANVIDQSEQCILSSNNAIFCFINIFSASVTNVPSYLKLYIKVTIGGPWKTGTASLTNPLWNPSIVIFKI